MRVRVCGAAFALSCLILVPSCSSETQSSPSTERTQATDEAPPMATTPTPTAASGSGVLFDFAQPQSVSGWSSVDDSVMGGISKSTTTWADTNGSGALLFSGLMTTEQNGGFASTLGPADQILGQAASGAKALGVNAIGDGRTYVLQLRAGQSGADRWIARFTPLDKPDGTTGNLVSIPLESFAPVDRFLRPTTPRAPLDPASIVQISIYLIDEQVGNFRLAIKQITAIR